MPGVSMSAIDEVLTANNEYASSFNLRDCPREPARHLAVLTCIDARIDALAILGLAAGDAHILRNAGAVVTEDVLRSLIISHHLLGTREIMVIGHTDCGMATATDDELFASLVRKSGHFAATPERFHTFRNVEQSVRDQLSKLRSHPWIGRGVVTRGFVYNVATGRLNEIAVQFESEKAA